jgi:hypothetical protein
MKKADKEQRIQQVRSQRREGSYDMFQQWDNADDGVRLTQTKRRSTRYSPQQQPAESADGGIQPRPNDGTQNAELTSRMSVCIVPIHLY